MCLIELWILFKGTLSTKDSSTVSTSSSNSLLSLATLSSKPPGALEVGMSAGNDTGEVAASLSSNPSGAVQDWRVEIGIPTGKD